MRSCSRTPGSLATRAIHSGVKGTSRAPPHRIITKKMYSSTRANDLLATTPCGLITQLTIWMSASGKHLLQQQAQPQVLLLVDRDDQDRVVWVQQLLRQQQATLHHRQPLRVAVVVVGLDVVVVVLPVLRAGVVRRVDVDGVDFAPVREEQRLECVVVLGVDDRMERLVAAALDLARSRRGPGRSGRGTRRRRRGPRPAPTTASSGRRRPRRQPSARRLRCRSS